MDKPDKQKLFLDAVVDGARRVLATVGIMLIAQLCLFEALGL